MNRLPDRALRGAAAFLLLGVGAGAASASAPAWAAPVPGAASPVASECVGVAFSATPHPNARVSPGQKIVYRVVDTLVGDESVPGCSRDLRVSPLLDFVAVKPTGWYWPENSDGPLVTVDFAGPVRPGARLRGTVVMRVRVDAPPGAQITTSSGEAITHVVR